MQKLSKACKQVGVVTLDDDLVTALLYLRDRVILGSPRVVSAAHRNCLHLYTDASYGLSFLIAVVCSLDGFPKIWPWILSLP